LHQAFINQWEYVAAAVQEIAVSKGWWKGDRNNGEIIALMHSELSEALEGLRHGNPASEHIPAFSAVEEEFADVVIRIMDVALARGWKVADAIVAKIEFNRGREYMHGGKRF
jgi:NTP pyrophosphatase (non-canonical NTP hydrolase)